jgi:hypothetical protein
MISIQTGEMSIQSIDVYPASIISRGRTEREWKERMDKGLTQETLKKNEKRDVPQPTYRIFASTGIFSLITASRFSKVWKNSKVLGLAAYLSSLCGEKQMQM